MSTEHIFGWDKAGAMGCPYLVVLLWVFLWAHLFLMYLERKDPHIHVPFRVATSGKTL